MLIMEQIEAAMYQKMKISGRLTEKQMEKMQGVGRDLTTDRGQRENIIRWFVDTQAVPLLCDGSFLPWFQGFISRQEAEDQLRDKNIGCFLIRLSEKNIGYILSYKGHERCRHFVINQTRTGLLVVSGDSTTHNSLTELIDHFKTTPIQPFGEYLTSSTTDADSVEEDSRNEVYDVVRSKPIMKLGVSVKALKSLWEQTSDAHHKTPSVLPSKSSRKLTTSTSFDKNSHSQDMSIPPLPKKNAPLRNSVSTGFLDPHASHDKQHLFEPMTSSTGVDERVPGIKCRDSLDTKGGNSQLKSPENIPAISIQVNPTNWSLTPQDEYNEKSPSLAFGPCNPTSSFLPQLPPKTASSSYAFLVFKKAHMKSGQAALQPNPLYESVCIKKEVQLESDYDNRTKSKTLLFDDTYQVIPEQCDNDTYEHILEFHRSNTYEDIPASDNDTYASLEEMQPQKKKWWKFRPESKKN